MHSSTNAETMCADLKLSKDKHTLLEIVKEVCSDPNNKLSTKLKGKLNRIIADTDLKHYSSVHKVTTADDSISTLLGFIQQTNCELTFDEQSELNLAVVQNIEKKLPTFVAELDKLKHSAKHCAQLRKDKMKELRERDNELDALREQEIQKMELMLEWLNHRIQGVANYSENSSELLKLKTKIMDLKSKILHLQMLHTIFTETNQSIKAYREMHKDLKDCMKETEVRIKEIQGIIDSDC